MSNKLVRNEQRKLGAAYVDGIALEPVGVGVVAQALPVTLASVFVMVCFSLVSFVLHWFARNLLGGLEE
ncbi:hypothetical protein SAMN05428969_2360 [Devosia sp. YR412]|uniref:hypothetical protein n=1 Tax=Devosia sp. YR412 TaxID=1881030 RepID=UPI0008CA7B29|nr:hypothetical protein [Devosia sp. YR412]SEQ24132.1 hypothetical protein SAMN05428969_2360 [Devosia sp. YR412]